VYYRGLFAGLALGASFALPPAHAATMVKPMTLEEVTAESQHVVHAVVTSVTSGRDESGVPSTWTTFAVAETLKGDDAPTFTIKQFGVATPLSDGTVARLAGLPSYEVGEEVVVFLRDPSRRGFTSPVGLGQGIYRVKRHGTKPEVRSDDQPQGVQDLDALVTKVKAHARKGK
jgi:hypothetical protein